MSQENNVMTRKATRTSEMQAMSRWMLVYKV